MFGFFRKTQLRTMLDSPTGEQLAEFIYCFDAGFQRGLNDVLSRVPAGQWVELISASCLQIARDRSAVEAGCWLAGVINGWDGALNNSVRYSTKLAQQTFYAAWDKGQIEECALQTSSRRLRRRAPAELQNTLQNLAPLV